MATASNRSVEKVVQQILDEVDRPSTPAIDQLRARAAALSDAEQAAILENARRKNLPLLGTSSPAEPPAPGVIDRKASAAGA